MLGKKSKTAFFLPSLNSDILDAMPFGIYVISPEGIIQYLNPEMLKISGAKSIKEVKGLNVLTLKNYEKSGLTKHILQGLSGKGFEINSIKHISFSGQKTTYRHYYGIPVKGNSGKVEKLLCIVKDITNRVKKENELVANEAKFRVLVQMSPDCIKLFDLDMKVFYMNPAGLREHSLQNSEDIFTWDFVNSIEKGHRQRFKRAFLNAKKGLSVSVLIKHVPGKSDRDWCHVSLAPIKGNDGETTSVLGISRDITKVKDVEKTLNEKMIEVEKMNKLMIGREVKMSELKKKIKALEGGNSNNYKVTKTIYGKK